MGSPVLAIMANLYVHGERRKQSPELLTYVWQVATHMWMTLG